MSFPPFSPRAKWNCAFVLTLSFILAGCVGYEDRPRERHVRVVQATYVQPVVVEQEDYVYYPSYQMYYGRRSHQYYYQEGSSWVARPAPQGISVSVLLSSPSASMEFHDSPAMHHAQVIQTYPRTWAQSHENKNGKHGDKDEDRDDRR
jgi:hypothetical protein